MPGNQIILTGPQPINIFPNCWQMCVCVCVCVCVFTPSHMISFRKFVWLFFFHIYIGDLVHQQFT